MAFDPDFMAAIREADNDLLTWKGGRFDIPTITQTKREADEAWAAHGVTDLGGWVGFGPTPAAALRDLASKCRRTR